MDQQPPPSNFADPMSPAASSPPAGLNVLGLIGFIISLLGLFGICFPPIALLSIIGVILSFIGMLKPKRGLAIAGFVIGLIGSIVAIAIIVVFGAAVLVGGAGIAMMPQFDATADAMLIEMSVDEYRQQNDALPETLADLPNLQQTNLEDHWGNPYRYTVDQEQGTWTLTGDGEDGIEGTDDDMQLHPDP